jgi:polyisoprenoid-binding protein YceI
MMANEITAKTIWSIDQENSVISFNVRHLTISFVKGEFKTFDASISTTGKNFSTAQINFWVNTSSITTNHVKRDWHLKSEDILDIKNHRYITFTSSAIGRSSANCDHELCGELTMMGITRKITLNVHAGGILNDHWGHERAAFTVSGKINRSDWGLTWNAATESGGLVIGDEVEILCEVELTNMNKVRSGMQKETTKEYGAMG